MTPPDARKVGYVLKMYPRFSETFILTEILELERRGWDLEILSLRLPVDGRFHPDLARVQAPVHYLQAGSVVKVEHLWTALRSFLDACGPVGSTHLEMLSRLSPREAAQALDVARIARRDGLTHLHAHFGSTATSVARLAAALAGITYSFTAHAKDIFHEEVQEADLAQKLADASHVVTVSEYNVQFLREHYGAAADRVVMIHNGLDLERFAARTLRPVREVPRVVSVGRLVEKKGMDTLLDAVALLRDRGTALRVQIAGAGPLRDQLADQVERLDLGGTVDLLGPLPQDRVRELVADADVFAAPCRVGVDGNRDGLPTVLLEAMALGTPCVSTPVTGIPEVVRDQETGLLVPEDDPSALAAALGSLIADADLRARLAAAARALIVDEFDARRQSALVGELFTTEAAA
jgi:glycosyltransferase involved in cell wall biosynthesis